MIYSYHITDADLKVGDYLEVKRSKQKKKRIFASTHVSLSILHATKGKDSSLQVCGPDDDCTEAYERSEGALEKEFKGKKLFVYFLEDDGDVEKDRQFRSERVYDKDKEIKYKMEISCALTFIEKWEEEKTITVYRYPNKPSYIKD